ncbi:MAG: isoamylase early set domain-containing protein [Candidatus Promineofilum sp.]|nr:isoamylase early set domain-containing protein [Promineifilum sp.]
MLKKKYVKAKDEYEVTFELPADAKEVTLVCEANGWEPVTMKKSKGTFAAKLRLPANGRYQYRYLVNNAEWVNDDNADGYMPNEHGTTNSVVETYSAN